MGNANLNIFHELTACNDDASTLMTTDQGHFGGLTQRLVVLLKSLGSRTYQRPIALPCVEVGVADARKLDVDEDFIGAGLCHGDLPVLEGSTCLLNDLSPLLLGNLGGHCADVCLGESVEEEKDLLRRLLIVNVQLKATEAGMM